MPVWEELCPFVPVTPSALPLPISSTMRMVLDFDANASVMGTTGKSPWDEARPCALLRPTACVVSCVCGLGRVRWDLLIATLTIPLSSSIGGGVDGVYPSCVYARPKSVGEGGGWRKGEG